jgi:membrane protein implicated in regulation of membrane protease activity
MATATAIYLTIGAVGVIVLALSLLGGELLSFLHVGDGPVSLEVVTGFLGAFGFAAAITAELSGSPALPPVVGLAAAFPTAWLAWRLSRAARTMPTDATPRRQDLVGTLGVIVTAVPSGTGYGEVRVLLGGQPVKLYARAEHPIAAGAHVFVVEAPSDTSVVVEQTLRIDENTHHTPGKA